MAEGREEEGGSRGEGSEKWVWMDGELWSGKTEMKGRMKN